MTQLPPPPWSHQLLGLVIAHPPAVGYMSQPLNCVRMALALEPGRHGDVERAYRIPYPNMDAHIIVMTTKASSLRPLPCLHCLSIRSPTRRLHLLVGFLLPRT